MSKPLIYSWSLWRAWSCFFLFSIPFLFLSCQTSTSQRLTIATAANLQFVIPELVQVFTEKTGIECEIILSSSGKLTAQIKEGAPFDLFLSADMKYPQELVDNGFAISPPQVYAFGKLVLWSLSEEWKPSIEILTKDSIQYIALANPKTAPYGSAAIQVLQHYNILQTVGHKLVYGESIAQTNQFLTTQAAEIGFTAKSVVLSSKVKNKGHWINLPEDIYTPIAQGVVVLKQKKHLAEAQQFQDFLFSTEGKEILTKFGYSSPETR